GAVGALVYPVERRRARQQVGAAAAGPHAGRPFAKRRREQQRGAVDDRRVHDLAEPRPLSLEQGEHDTERCLERPAGQVPEQGEWGHWFAGPYRPERTGDREVVDVLAGALVIG